MTDLKFSKSTDSLFEVILELKNLREAKNFFRDLCTIEEIKNMSDRWEAAQMIEKGIPYREIAEKLDLSTTTVSRVALWLNNGKGGYRLALDRLNSSKSAIHHNNSSFGKGLR